MKKCSIIIASYNDADNLKNCLASIQKVDYPEENYEVIVVDNNSSDNTGEVVRHFPQVIYLQEDKRGASHARNKGIAHARHGTIAFLDSDTIVSANWLKKILEPFDDENVGAVGGEIRPMREDNLISQYMSVSLFMRYHRYGKKRAVKGYPSCNLAVKKDLISKGFDVSAFETYGEDKDLCYQVLEKGFKIIFQPGAIAYHKHPASVSELFMLIRKSTKGRLVFFKKHRTSLDGIIMSYQLPLLYVLLMIYMMISGKILPFYILLMSPLAVLSIGSFAAFVNTKRLFLSFVLKPSLDIISIFLIYFYFNYYSFIQHPQKGV